MNRFKVGRQLLSRLATVMFRGTPCNCIIVAICKQIERERKVQIKINE